MRRGRGKGGGGGEREAVGGLRMDEDVKGRMGGEGGWMVKSKISKLLLSKIL